MKSLLPPEFIALDLETTGLDPSRDEIIELGCVLFKSGEPAAEFITFVNAKRPVPPFITALTGITQSQVDSGVPLEEGLTGFLEFAGNRPLVAHNSSFDMSFLQSKLKTKKMGALTNPVYDSLLIARLSLPGQTSYKLESLAQGFGIGNGKSHRAGNDALTCGKLFVLSLSSLAGMPEAKLAKLSKLVRSHATDTLKLLGAVVPIEEAPVKKKVQERLPEPLIEPEKPEEIPGSEMEAVFGRDGALSGKLEGFEFREGQLEMAQAVLTALNSEELLAVEAGTGTGKSLAYLAAAALYASKNNIRIVISTRTKALQDQIYKKEIPFLREQLHWAFRATLLKGRSNYLCLRKWEEMMNGSAFLLRGWEADELVPLVPWAETTESGDISECLSFNEKENRILWARLSSDAETCRGSRCGSFQNCFVMRKRREALSSHIVLVNHSLFFTDLKGQGAVLGNYSRVIFDEAHSLEDVGRKHLGDEISHLAFSVTLQKLYKNEEGGRGLLKYLESFLRREKGEGGAALLDQISVLSNAVAGAELGSVRFFRSLGNQLKKEKRADKLRYDGSLFSAMELKESAPDIEPLAARLSAFIDSFSKEYREDSEMKSLLFDVSAVIHELTGLAAVLHKLLHAEDPALVYWAEGSQNPLNAKLVGAPLEIRKIFSERFLEGAASAVFTSATLAVKGSLDYFCGRTGLTLTQAGRITSKVIPSHYNFREQLRCAAIRGISAPGEAGFTAEVSAIASGLSAAMNKRMLFLFTSREMLRSVYEIMAPKFAAENRHLFAQDINGSGWQLLEEMRKNPGAVLLGTDSFWEGIDLPGDYLEILLLARLPFSVPTDPVVEARTKACEARGENSFNAFYLPEAVIKFRQGVGRLIRRRDDRGAVVILDKRIVEKPYGKVFLNSIEADKAVYEDSEGLLSGIMGFFEKG